MLDDTTSRAHAGAREHLTTMPAAAQDGPIIAPASGSAGLAGFRSKTSESPKLEPTAWCILRASITGQVVR